MPTAVLPNTVPGFCPYSRILQHIPCNLFSEFCACVFSCCPLNFAASSRVLGYFGNMDFGGEEISSVSTDSATEGCTTLDETDGDAAIGVRYVLRV